MELTVRGHRTYCYTGGKDFDASKPTAVFLHGVLNDHSVWGLQSRYLANHGWNVLAVDLPGHCRSAGEAPSSTEQAADFVKKDDFNNYYIRCVGKHVTIKINGETTVDDDFAKMPEEGIIAFQLHAGGPMEVTFSHIEFKELNGKK